MPPYHRLIETILALRRTLFYLLLLVASATVIFFFLSPALLSHLQGYLGQKLVFYTVAEPFLAHVTLALTMALLTLMPVLFFFFWKALGKPFGLSAQARFFFTLFTIFLFYAGAGFCYCITLPFGIRYLLGFETTELKALISVAKCVSFVSLFILGFGAIFELPLFMIFTAKAGIIGREQYEKNRRYAIFAICIIAAVLTPTPDAFNMLLMGLPLYLLYESGILAMRFIRI